MIEGGDTYFMIILIDIIMMMYIIIDMIMIGTVTLTNVIIMDINHQLAMGIIRTITMIGDMIIVLPIIIIIITTMMATNIVVHTVIVHPTRQVLIMRTIRMMTFITSLVARVILLTTDVSLVLLFRDVCYCHHDDTRIVA